MSVGRFVGDLSGWFVIIPREEGELHSLVLIEVLVNSNYNPLLVFYLSYTNQIMHTSIEQDL